MAILQSPLSQTLTLPMYALASLALALCITSIVIYGKGKSNRGGIPSIAPRWREWFPITGYGKLREYIVEGSRKYPNSTYRMPVFPQGNIIILNGTKLTSELRNASDEIFSFTTFANRSVQGKYTMGEEGEDSTYHTPLVRSTLTRNLGTLFPDIAEEMKYSFETSFGDCKEWTPFKIHRTLMDIVCRTSNRVLVGPELCRHPVYQKLNVDFTVEVMKSAFLINLFPSILHPIVGPIFSTRRQHEKSSTDILRNEIETRRANLAKYGPEWADKPNDYLMWLIEAAPPGKERELSQLALRVMQVNFAAIHTSSLTFSHALLHLAAHPEYVKPLRDEVERIVADEGWTKMSMQKMRKIDSFIRESSRMNALGLLSLGRYALKDYTFSDGSKVPKGTSVAVSAYSAHMDDANHANPEKFDPFRYSELRDEDGEGTKHQMVATSPDYLPFGLGRHACPGRFFAANEIKAMLCYVVMNYDVMLPGGSTERPANRYFGAATVPSKDDTVLVRMRKRAE